MKKTISIILLSLFGLCFSISCKNEKNNDAFTKKINIISDESAKNESAIIQKITNRILVEKSNIELVNEDEADILIKLVIEDGIGNEGYKIEEHDGNIEIIGNDKLGLLYGVGKFLHTSKYNEKQGFLASKWRGKSNPETPLRAMYFATHFDNYYMAAPLKDVEKYMEDISLWGFNVIFFKFATYEYKGINDPQAQVNLSRIKQLMILAKKIGLKVGITNTTNGGYKTASKDILAKIVPDGMHRRGWHGVNICSNSKQGSAYLLDIWNEIFDQFENIGIDYFRSWPYDSGGCGCDLCWPWGAKGYLNISEKVSKLAKSKYPELKFILSTWMYDTPEAGEWDGLTEYLKDDNSWTDYIMADSHGDFPEYPLINGVPGNLPLVNFPEISMWGQEPWGGFGANPLPNRFQKIWNKTKDKISGGVPYSEGMYEDINKIIFSQFYWKKDKNAIETVKEYISYYYSPDYVPELLKVISIMEETHERHNLNNKVEEAYKIMLDINSKLDKNVIESNRWRLLFIRAKIDNLLFSNQKKNEKDILKMEYSKVMNIVRNNSLKAYGALGSYITFSDILIDYKVYYNVDNENVFLENFSILMKYFSERYPELYIEIEPSIDIINEIFETEYYQTNHIIKKEYEEIKSCFDEITDIYQAQNAFQWLQPYQLP